MNLIVFDIPHHHLITRGGAIIFAIIIIYYGNLYKNKLLILIGLITLFYDSYTFYLTLQKLKIIN